MISRGQRFILGVFIIAQCSATVPLAADTASADGKSGPQTLPDSVVVVPYQKRPTASHEITLRNGRRYFVIELEATETEFLVRTAEGERLTLNRAQVLEIKQLKQINAK